MRKTFIESSSLFTDFNHVISGARQSATQEFAQFWEILGQPKPVHSRNSQPDIVYGRIIPDPQQRHIIKDAEIQTDLFIRKRKAESDLHGRTKKNMIYQDAFIPETRIDKLIHSPALTDSSHDKEPIDLTSRVRKLEHIVGYVRTKINEYEANEFYTAMRRMTFSNEPPSPQRKVYQYEINKHQDMMPYDRHKAKMRELLNLLPYFKLRKADTLINAEGKRVPNPYWKEIYDP